MGQQVFKGDTQGDGNLRRRAVNMWMDALYDPRYSDFREAVHNAKMIPTTATLDEVEYSMVNANKELAAGVLAGWTKTRVGRDSG